MGSEMCIRDRLCIFFEMSFYYYLDAPEDNMSITLYHYTNIEGIRGISSSGFIEESGGGRDANFGEGVYLTSLKPTESKIKIVANNWGNKEERKLERAVQEGRVDFAVEIEIPRSDPNLKKCDTSSRRKVYLYEARIYLADFEFTFVVVGKEDSESDSDY